MRERETQGGFEFGLLLGWLVGFNSFVWCLGYVMRLKRESL